MSVQSKTQFLEWLKKTYPLVFEAAYEKMYREQGLQAETPTEENWLDKILNSVSQVAPAILSLKQQKELLDIQMDRAKKGLPPLEVSQYAPTVNVGVSSDVMDKILKIGVPLSLAFLAVKLLGKR